MLTLYQFRHSTFCLKTRMALHAKKIIYKVEEVTPGLGQIEIFQISGQKQVPIILDDNNQVISDSTKICEYIDNKNDNHKLFPEDPFLLAHAKLIEDWADTTMAFACKNSLLNASLENNDLRSALLPDEIPQSIKGIVNKLPLQKFGKVSKAFLNPKSNLELQKILESLSKALSKKQFLINDNLSIADISIAAQLSLLKFPSSSGQFLEGKGCPEFINNPYLESLFRWRDNLEEYLFSAKNQ